MNGKCKLKSFTMFNLKTFEASCNLYFGANTKFEYKILDNKAILFRKGMDLKIPLDSFEDNFEIIEKEI